MTIDRSRPPISRTNPARRIRVAGEDGSSYVLRPTLVSDVDAILDAFEESLTELRRFMPWSHAPQSVTSQIARLKTVEADYFGGREMTMGLFRETPAGERFVVMVGLHPRVALNPAALEVGYWARTSESGRGLTVFATKIAVAYAFDKLGADRVQAICDSANVASRRVLERVGFALEGTLANLTARPSEALLAAGFVHTGANPMFALTPERYAELPWVAPQRARTTYENILGEVEA
jgi:ribosomal-protein-serine acetyltransferase